MRGTMNGGPESFLYHFEFARTSYLSEKTLWNGDKQSHNHGDWSGNNGSNNNTNSNNNNTNNYGHTYNLFFSAAVSAPPPPAIPIRRISRAPTEPPNANQVGYHARKRRGGMLALHSAAEMGAEIEVERILEGWVVKSLTSKRMRDVGERDEEHGMNPLHYAAKRGNPKVVQLILSYHEKRARFEFGSRSGKKPPKNGPEATPQAKIEEAVKSLLAIQSEEDGMDALHYAAIGGHDDVARSLLEAGADVTAGSRWACMNPMHYAALLGNVNILLLLKFHLNIQETGRKPKDMHKPPEGKHPPLPVPGENAANSTPDAQMGWNTVRSKKARGGRRSKPSRENNPEQNRRDNPEQKATFKDMLETEGGYFGMTPLHFAAAGGRNIAVEFLIKSGASIKARCRQEGRAPIHYAAMYGHVSTTKLLHDRGADINVASEKERMAPLHYAAQMGHKDVVKYLCDNNADFAASCQWRQMIPLHYAAERGHEVVVRMLVLYHQPITPLRDNCGRTAAQHAEENGSESLRDFLSRYPTRR